MLFALFVGLCVFTLVRSAYAPGNIEPCHIETRDGYYAKEDTFHPGEPVYVNGSEFTSNVWVDIYVVNDTTWNIGRDIPSDGIVTTVKTGSSGEIPHTMVWASAKPGKYDIVVDVNRDRKYNNDDCLLDNHISVTAGFLVIPEYVIGTAMGVAGFFAAFGTYRLLKRKNNGNLPR